MKAKVLFVAFASLAVGVFVWRGSVRKPEVKGLVSPTVEITLIASISATPSPDATKSAEASASSTPKPTKKPTTTPTPTAESSATVYGLVERFASQYGVDPNVLRHMALCESGFRSNAVNGPYVGLFQFGKTTWETLRKEMGEESDPILRFSAEESVQTAAYAFSKGKAKIWPNCVP